MERRRADDGFGAERGRPRFGVDWGAEAEDDFAEETGHEVLVELVIPEMLAVAPAPRLSAPPREDGALRGGATAG